MTAAVKLHGLTAVTSLDSGFRSGAKPRTESHSSTPLQAWLSGAWVNYIYKSFMKTIEIKKNKCRAPTDYASTSLGMALPRLCSGVVREMVSMSNQSPWLSPGQKTICIHPFGLSLEILGMVQAGLTKSNQSPGNSARD